MNCDSRRAMYGETFFNVVKLTVILISVVILSVLMQCVISSVLLRLGLLCEYHCAVCPYAERRYT